MNKRKSILLVFITLTIAAVFHLIDIYQFNSISPLFLRVLRWMFIASLILFALYKKSLTTWILVSMAVGVEIGLDFPEVAKDLRFLSKIFLRLIKTIIAPILFSTLVVGIAGHSNLKQVGRMGWKSIVYFEVVTTLALVIGIVAINFTKAGAGIVLPEHFQQDLPEAKAQNWQDVVLHIFPENIVKSIYNGDVLPIVVFSVIFGISLALLPEAKKKPLLQFSESLAETMF